MSPASNTRRSAVLWIAASFVAIAVVLYFVVRNREADPGTSEVSAPARTIDVMAATARAEQGDADAQNRLGEAYLAGTGVKQSFSAAVDWFQRAADQGHAGAQNNLGMLFEAGQGVPSDYETAAAWYRKAAEQGQVDAQYNLASMYVYARGVPRDDSEALKWLSKAADQGDGLACLAMGERHVSGVGVAKDSIKAYQWYALAAATGVDDAKIALDGLKATMTGEQIREGERLVSEFKPAPGWTYSVK